MSRLMCIIIQKILRAKFSGLEIDPRKTRKFCASKMWCYTVRYLCSYIVDKTLERHRECSGRDGKYLHNRYCHEQSRA